VEDNGIVHILDVVFIKKDADGLVTSFEYDGLDDVLEFGFEDIDGEAGGMLNDEDLQLVAEGLEPDSSAALIVWEHRWAARVAQAIRDAGGRIVGGERVPHEIVQGRWPTASRWSDGEGSAMLRRGIGRVGRPGLIGTMARTAAVAGTATAVSGGVARRQQARAQESAEAEAWREQQAQPPPMPEPPPPAAPPADLVTQLRELADLKDQGILTQQEFDTQKARLLGS
jgi:hypothetical protein